MRHAMKNRIDFFFSCNLTDDGFSMYMLLNIELSLNFSHVVDHFGLGNM